MCICSRCKGMATALGLACICGFPLTENSVQRFEAEAGPVAMEVIRQDDGAEVDAERETVLPPVAAVFRRGAELRGAASAVASASAAFPAAQRNYLMLIDPISFRS